MAEAFVALLRGINVGGNNKLPMKALAVMFEKAGASEVKTFIQSGNVLFKAEPEAVAAIAKQVSAHILSDFGYKIPLVLRSRPQLEKTLAHNPYLKEGANEDALHVMFLADEPGQSAVTKLDPDKFDPDKFTLHGADIYLFLPNGVGRSKLTNAYFDSRLSTVSTSRNWRTVNKLLELMPD